MSKPRFWILVAITAGLLLFAVARTLVPPDNAPSATDAGVLLPWTIITDGAGSSTVFGNHFGVTPFAMLEVTLGGDAELSLFEQADGTLALEAFFDNRMVHGLKADFITVLDVEPNQLRSMYDRGLRIARGIDSTRRVTLHPDDARAARALAITTLTYLPAIDLETDLLERRFGSPEERIRIKDGSVHWLYPDRGLDIVVSDEGREVMQYVAPRDFARLRAPLAQP